MSLNNPSIHVLTSIGYIKTPYEKSAPYQAITQASGEFVIILDQRYAAGLYQLDTFKYLYVIYFLDKLARTPKMMVQPPWARGTEVGVFASRSPNRPNPIGISIVEIKKISGNKIYISGIDAFNGTPVLDIKPYIDELDVKKDANLGWVEKLDGDEHLMLHIKGIPHEH